MSLRTYLFVAVAGPLLWPAAFAQDLGILPPKADWLVDPTPYRARVVANEPARELVLENGLARRVIRLAPNGATVELQNLTTGEHLLRAVSPEARVTLNGTPFEIGGLRGQKIGNFLRADQVDDLVSNPDAYHYTGWRELPVSERLKWKKRPEWMARDLPWPPPGKHVVMQYQAPESSSPGAPGPVLFEETFGRFGPLAKGWDVQVSKSHPSSSFSNEGKTGEIMTLPDTCVFAERDWVVGTAVVDLTLDSGDDEYSNAWGPGLALVATDGSTASFVVRPNQQVFETSAGIAGKYDRTKPVKLRLRLAGGNLNCEASQESQAFQKIASIPWPKTPAKLRIGKVGRGGDGKDYGTDGKLIRSRLIGLELRGPDTRTNTSKALPAIEVHYEIYDGIPLFSKWLVVRNDTPAAVRVNRFVAEELRLCEAEARGGDCHGPLSEREEPNLYVETDMAFGGRMYATADNHAVKLEADPDYSTHVSYSYSPPTLLRVTPRAFHPGDSADPAGAEDKDLGPDQEIAPGGTFESFRTFELLIDSNERERRTLARRRMYRVIAPWTQENPLMFHKIQADPKTVREAIDQAAEAGFELVILSFGSGFNVEKTDPAYIASYKELADYGRSKGVALGGYSLLASRGAPDPRDNATGPCMFGRMPCLGSTYGRLYLSTVAAFYKKTGFGAFENDGSYPGDRCGATHHPGHRGFEDSQWTMWRGITGLYQELRANGVYLNIPDWYFLAGSNKASMGYRETNWSLPRRDQEIIERQNIYDGTWTRTPSMGWMFVPLSQYHGGGAEATIEPLKEHLPHYETRLANLLGAGVQACYRGPRLFDCDETKAVVQKWVGFYKQHREVLDADILHLRRADGRDWDGILHVNPQGQEKAMAFLYNPLPQPLKRTIRLPLYYAGLRSQATVVTDGGASKTIALGPDHVATMEVTIPAEGRIWLLFKP